MLLAAAELPALTADHFIRRLPSVLHGNVTGIAFPVKIHAVWEMKPAALLVADAWRHRRKGFTKAIRLDFLRGQGRCQWAGFAA
jgi:hypothetical protein